MSIAKTIYMGCTLPHIIAGVLHITNEMLKAMIIHYICSVLLESPDVMAFVGAHLQGTSFQCLLKPAAAHASSSCLYGPGLRCSSVSLFI